MRETSELPTTSLRAPNRHSSFPHTPIIPAHTHVIPAKAGIQLAVYTIRQNPTQSDKILQKLVCARDAHAREGRRSVSLASQRHSREGGNPFSRHGLPPGRSGFDVSLGVAVS